MLLLLDYQQQHLTRLRGMLSLVVYPIQYVVNIPHDIYDGMSLRMQSHQSLVEANQKLKAENLQLKLQMQRVAAVEAENLRLKELLKTPIRPDDKVTVAEVLQIDMDAFTHRVVINRGSADNVYEGQPAVDPLGILGQVIQVGPRSSVVLLITDKQHTLPVQSLRSGARALAKGTGKFNELQLSHATATSDFKVGDQIVSSGLGQRFPRGYPVGEVVAVDTQASNQFARVIVKPHAHTDSVRDFLLVWPEGLTAEELAKKAKQEKEAPT